MSLAALLGALGVGAAARATHGGLPYLAIAGNFLLMHAPVLLFLSLFRGSRFLSATGWTLLAGLVLFAGDLAFRDLVGPPLFPYAAPLGGIGLIGGWLLIAIGAWVSGRRR